MIDPEDFLRVRTVVTVVTSVDGEDVTSLVRLKNEPQSVTIDPSTLTSEEVVEVTQALTKLGLRTNVTLTRLEVER